MSDKSTHSLNECFQAWSNSGFVKKATRSSHYGSPSMVQFFDHFRRVCNIERSALSDHAMRKLINTNGVPLSGQITASYMAYLEGNQNATGEHY